MNCVIADSSKIIRILLSKIITNLGYTVTVAENGDELLRQYTQTQPDLIICDWDLPLIAGIDALYTIRNNKQIKQPIFIFCAYTKDSRIINQALNGNADDFIMRPFDEDIIVSKLKLAILNRQRTS
jgi:two-component system chemotaxis response regulator CheY